MAKILFQDDAPVWMVSEGPEVRGPFRASEIYDRLNKRELSWVHYVSRTRTDGPPSAWTRICDEETFKSVGPAQPEKQPQVKKSTKTPPALNEPEEAAEWFLYFNQAQHGPFSDREVRRLISIGKIHARVHGWREGMEDWQRLESIETYAKEFKPDGPGKTTPKPAADAVEENRAEPRKPLVARIHAANDRILASGICRDISVGGMQVLVDRVPGKVGDRVKLNISPIDEGKMKAFVAKGVIVRILEDGRGFSFRFENLDAGARTAIDKFIANSE